MEIVGVPQSQIGKRVRDEMGNNFIKNYFSKNFGIDCEKIAENKGQNGNTPDFLLKKENIIFAICEVKNLELNPNDGTWKVVGNVKEKDYLSISKIISKIKKAYEQLRSSQLLKVLVFVDFWSDHITSLDFVLKSDIKRIEGIKNRIDLYIWIDKGNTRRKDIIYFRYYNDNGKRLREKWAG